jgi:hypothetical protein
MESRVCPLCDKKFYPQGDIKKACPDCVYMDEQQKTRIDLKDSAQLDFTTWGLQYSVAGSFDGPSLSGDKDFKGDV